MVIALSLLCIVVPLSAVAPLSGWQEVPLHSFSVVLGWLSNHRASLALALKRGMLDAIPLTEIEYCLKDHPPGLLDHPSVT
jgi:hypothetical protein